MTDNEQVQFRSEGDPAFGEDNENDNSTDSPSDETKTDDADDSSEDGGEKKPDAKKNVPFDQHPAWQEREKKWDSRFNDQESRHQEDMRKMREEFGSSRKDDTKSSTIPAWFGGDQDQWEAYQADEKAKEARLEEAAYQRMVKGKEAETKAVEEATTFMKTELASLEADQTINPTGAKIDPNKLLKFVLDNDLVDSKGRWNYRAGFKLMQGGETKKPAGDRKQIAGASTSEGKSETKPAAFKTSADFKKNRPW